VRNEFSKVQKGLGSAGGRYVFGFHGAEGYAGFLRPGVDEHRSGGGGTNGNAMG
jgi:hypothetical protein